MNVEAYIDSLATTGRYHFTINELTRATRTQPQAARVQLERLQARGLIAAPLRSFFVVIPPQYRSQGCPPAELFIDQLMTELGVPYYLCLLSAAERYGAHQQVPAGTQVMVPTKRKPIKCGQEQVRFVVRADAARQPRRSFATARGQVAFATPEVTALELVGYPREALGLANIAALLRWLRPEVCPSALVAAARLSPPAWSQRLGYLFETTGAYELSDALMSFVREAPRSDTPLVHHNGTDHATYNEKWQVLLNFVPPRGSRRRGG